MPQIRANRWDRVNGTDIGLELVDQFGFRHVRVTEPLGWHCHTGYEFVFVLGGHVVYEIDGGKECPLAGGEYSLTVPKTMHRARDSRNSPCKLVWIVFSPATRTAGKAPFRAAELEAIGAACERAGNSRHLLNPRLSHLLTRLGDSVAAHKHTPLPALERSALRLVVCQLIIEAAIQLEAPPSRTADEFVTHAVRRMKAHLAEPFRVAALAENLGVSHSSLYRAFRSQLGQTPSDYMQRLRIEEAKSRLQSTTESCTQIAMDLGFSSSQYFSQTFKRYTGRSPLEFRQSASPVRT
jgi:AraC-like DNA-binding protein